MYSSCVMCIVHVIASRMVSSPPSVPIPSTDYIKLRLNESKANLSATYEHSLTPCMFATVAVPALHSVCKHTRFAAKSGLLPTSSCCSFRAMLSHPRAVDMLFKTQKIGSYLINIASLTPAASLYLASPESTATTTGSLDVE